MTHESARIRILLLHARLLFRTGLARLLSAEPDFELAGECATPAEALKGIARSKPDIVLFDLAMQEEFVTAVRGAAIRSKLLAVAEELDTPACVRALRAAVSGIFLASDSPAHLIQAIRVVMSRGAWLDQSMIQLLADHYPVHEEIRLGELAEREQAVLRGILGGLSNRKISDQIGVSEGTVKGTLQQLFNKSGVRTRSQLVRIMLTEAVHK